MKRSTKWLLGGLAGVSLAVLLALVFVLNTRTGTGWVINYIDGAIPGTIEIDRYSGTLWSGLQIPSVRYLDNTNEVNVDDAELRIDWSSLATGRFVVDLLTARSIIYQSSADEVTPETQTPKPFELEIGALPITVAIVESRIGSLGVRIGEGDSTVINISLDDALLEDSSLQVAALSATVETINLSISDLSAELSGDIPLSMSLQWALVDTDWAGSGSLSGNLAALNFEHIISGPYAASAAGEIRLLHRIAPEVDAEVMWERWSFGDYTLESGMTNVRGTASNYAGDFAATLNMPGIEPTRLFGTANGNTSGLSTLDAQAENLAGIVDLSGSLAWQPVFTADADIHVSGFDPSPFVAALTGRLDADTHLRVHDTGNVEFSDAIVGGELNGAAVSGNGGFTIKPEELRCSNCKLIVGGNEIDVDGVYGEGGAGLKFSIAAPTLETFWPDLAGSLHGQGEVTAAATDPIFTGELQGANLQFDRWAATDMQLVSRSSSLQAIDLSLGVTSLAVDGSNIGSFSITGAGSQDSLGTVLAGQIRGIDVRAEASLGRNPNGVDATISSASVSKKTAGHWRLREPLNLALSGNDVSVNPHAWVSDLGQLQVSRFSILADEMQLVADLEGLPLQFANPFLPDNLRLSGSARSAINVQRNSGEWSGSIDWRQADTVLHVLGADDQSTDVIISKSELDVELVNGGATVSAAVGIEPDVAAELDLVLATLDPETEIDAELRLDGRNWQWLPAVFPVIDNFEGVIAARIRAAGALSAPEFSGDLDWERGRLVVPALNVPIADIDLTVAGSSAGSATVSATAKAGDGDLRVDGTVNDVMLESRSINLTVRGTGAELVNWPEYHLWASPDLVVVGSKDGWEFDGSLALPRAEVMVAELPADAVLPSSDVVVLGREAPVEQATNIAGKANLRFGDDVHVNAFGLDTNVRGELLLRMFEDRPISAEGEVTLVDGFFSEYGQKLTIEEGTLTFTGPLDNPIVDVRAVRVIEGIEGTVTAGIHLRGRAQSITSTVYSEPALAEADALSYLVVGRPLSQASESDGGELSRAALALGTKQAGRIAEQVGQALGLDQLTVAGGSGETTALVAGKQINSRLHARYAYGVFSRLGTLLVRYRLSKRLTLEAGAGEAQSIDILYQVEKE